MLLCQESCLDFLEMSVAIGICLEFLFLQLVGNQLIPASGIEICADCQMKNAHPNHDSFVIVTGYPYLGEKGARSKASKT